ncbi:Transcription elongation factor S-II, central domain [Phytophthora cinnamomi]|uniref:Transcription elongation factor S-II, central domain n=1 Tax=Phytophthora cinnamomi TaxID=4785 RepID=UPI0035598C28|nr:Transcription elongation factor S-II, central domain [Phytophthora cinnamomi]
MSEQPQQAAPEPPAQAQAEHTMTVDAVAAEAEAQQAAAKRKGGEDTPRKRRTPSPRAARSDKPPAEGDETESEPEKQPKKRAKTAAKGAKRGPGRKKKAEPAPDSDDEQREVERKVAALGDDIKGRFGQVVWAKMGGYPYWPCIITDPRLLPKKLQDTAVKALETKFLVFFFVSNNFAPVSFKMIEPWDDAKFNYREGHPEKDSKAPKRRVKLMAAIEVADKEIKLPIEERADGLLKPEEKVEEEEGAAVEPPPPVKRKPGRPPKNKAAAAKPAPKKTPKKRQAKGENAEEAADDKGGKETAVATTTQEEEEDAAGPTLSKEEIKAKVASRKTPKKKGADDGANAAGGSAKKAPKATVKHSKSNGSAEIDSKRKKEIELVVPHKTVKSADIREMTEEAAKKKLSGSKPKTKKDKGEYKVGDLALFASKMARLHAKESTRNNDELVAMMQELFRETLMYRSDVERSGLAAIIATLRKSLSPTVGQAASALRKHMIKILNNDTEISHLGKKNHNDAVAHGTKKRKAENGAFVKSEEHQKKSTSEPPPAPAANGDAKDSPTVMSPPTKSPSPSKKSDNATTKIDAVTTKEEKVAATETVATNDKVVVTKVEKVTTKEEKIVSKSGEDVVVKDAPSKDPPAQGEDTAEKPETTTEDNQPASPVKEAENSADGAAKDKEDIFEAPEHVDKNRKIFAEMLSKILDHEGSTRRDLAQEIEAALFERFKESNDDYLTQARIIIFGLKENEPMRERLYSGALHCLEFAYADDAFFKAE